MNLQKGLTVTTLHTVMLHCFTLTWKTHIKSDLLKLLSANSFEKIWASCFNFIQRRNWARLKPLVTFESPFNISCQHRDPFPSIVPKALMVSPSAFFVWDPLSGINNCRATTTTLVSPTPPASAGQLRNIFRPKTKWSAEECLKENDEEISETRNKNLW